MSLQGVLLDDTWTPEVRSIINNDIEIESITYYFSDTSTNVSGFEDFARDFIDEVDAAIDLDFIEASTNDSTTIDFYLRNWTDSDGTNLGLCTWYGSGYITSEVFVKNGIALNSNYNTFVHEFGHALGLGEPGSDPRWDQSDTAMSYNSNFFGEYRTSFAPADWSALESLWGVEDFILIGDSSANILQAQYGALHADSIDGGGGDDLLQGFGGKDTLIGGQGNDRLYGGYGGDDIYGQFGDDIIRASAGGDYVDSGDGNDAIYGGSGADTIIGGIGADTIRGGGGYNIIDAGDDNSRDQIYVYADVQLNGWPSDGSGADLLLNISFSDRIYILGSNPLGALEFFEDGDQINIFHDGAHEVSVLGSRLSIDQVRDMTSIA